jgi:long-subunit acyl-CoA synthetase (AMP-forming)
MKLDELAERQARHQQATIVEIDAAGRRREMTHAELGELARARAETLLSAGVLPGHAIGIQARNGIDWVAWDLAALRVGAFLQAYPDEKEIGDVGELLRENGLALLITDGAEHPSALDVAGAGHGKTVAAGARRHDEPNLHSLVYSSGTAGKLKGLKISRTGTEYVIDRFIDAFSATADDAHLIFLPLWNYQQRLSVYCCLWLGATFTLAPYQRVFPAVKAERPAFLIGPPVFYDTIAQLHRKTGGGESLRDFLGGRIRFLITGMAPIRRQTLDAFWAAGVPLLEAYGLTETGMIAWNTPDAHQVGSVGRLIDPQAVRFLSDGELLIRRPAPLSLGYFEADAQTADETFRPDGWIATGDYGTLDADGFLTLLGRKKDVLVLGSGRKVHPAAIESVLADVEGVAEVIVVPARQGLGAIVTPAVAGDEELRTALRRRIEEVNHKFDPYERIVATVFSDQGLRADPRFMTKNMKLSRPAAAAFFAERAKDR